MVYRHIPLPFPKVDRPAYRVMEDHPARPSPGLLDGRDLYSLGESFIDSFPIIKEKLVASELFISEAPTDRKAILDAINGRPATDTLKSIVSAEQLDQIKAIYHKSSEDIFKLTPSELLQQLIVFYFEYGCYPASLSDKYTVDEYLQQLARDNQKPAYFFRVGFHAESTAREQERQLGLEILSQTGRGRP